MRLSKHRRCDMNIANIVFLSACVSKVQQQNFQSRLSKRMPKASTRNTINRLRCQVQINSQKSKHNLRNNYYTVQTKHTRTIDLSLQLFFPKVGYKKKWNSCVKLFQANKGFIKRSAKKIWMIAIIFLHREYLIFEKLWRNVRAKIIEDQVFK